MEKSKRETWSKWEVDKLIELKQVEELEWDEIVKKFPTRNIEAIKKKYFRCHKTGYKRDKRIKDAPSFIDDKEKLLQFKKDYQGKELTTEEVMEKYSISSKTMLYFIVKKFGLYKYKRVKKPSDDDDDDDDIDICRYNCSCICHWFHNW
jgi:hypothetical protein